MEAKRPRLDDNVVIPPSDAVSVFSASIETGPPLNEAPNDTTNTVPTPLLSRLESLPEEIKYIIFKCSIDALTSLKATSRTMYKSVNEWAARPASLPPIDLQLTGKHPAGVCTEIHVRKSVYNIFRRFHPIFVEDAVWPTCTRIGEAVTLHGCIRQDDMYIIRNLDVQYDRVTLKMTSLAGGNYCPRVQAILDQAKGIQQLYVDIEFLDAREGNFFEYLIAKHKFTKLKMRVEAVCYVNAKQLLLDFAGRVNDLEIRQLPCDWMFNKFFGLRHLDWGDLSVKMLQKGLVRLAFFNEPNFNDFFTAAMLETVRSYLATTSFKHIFSTTVNGTASWLREFELDRNMLKHFKYQRFKQIGKTGFSTIVHIIRYRHTFYDPLYAVDEDNETLPYTALTNAEYRRIERK